MAPRRTAGLPSADNGRGHGQANGRAPSGAPPTYLPWPNALVQPIVQWQRGNDGGGGSNDDDDAKKSTASGHQLHIPAVETWGHFDHLAATSHLNGHSADIAPARAVKTEDAGDDDRESFRTASQPPAKKVKHEHTPDTPPQVTLFSTTLPFIANAPDGTEPTRPHTFRNVTLQDVRPLSALEADLLLDASAIEIRPSDGGLPLCTLPILNTLSETFPLEARPQGITNGPWIQAALSLTHSGILALQAHLHVEPHDQGIALTLHLTLSLGPQASIVDGGHQHNTKSLSHRQVTQLLQFTRFASSATTNPRHSDEDEAHRRATLDASAIYNVLSPATLDASALLFQHDDLAPTLLPFQRRSTAFLLAREGLTVDDDNKQLVVAPGVEITSRGESPLGLWWQPLGDSLYFHSLTGAFATDPATTRAHHIDGALLAEEMGLGKTVEVLALILLHPADRMRAQMPSYRDQVNEVTVQPVKTTLIVCPALLQRQWTEEIQRHAPSLRVYTFQGHVQAERDAKHAASWHDFAADYDVMIVNFATLQRELDVAIKDPPRSRRAPRKYTRPRCPLIQLEFFRVVCDEIQMVGNTTRAADVVSMIPRIYSIAVSGTPVKHINDLHAFFRFLRIHGVHPSLLREQGPSRLFAPHLFRALKGLTTRHLKSAVKGELTLPRQHRYVMPIDLTAVETAYYEDIWNAGLQVLGLDSSGGPTREDWQLDQALMRRHLLLLRQACTHPQVAGRILGSGNMAQGNLRTMAEVLVYMKEQATSDLYKARHTASTKAIDRVVVMLQDKSDVTRFDIAQALLETQIKELQVNCHVLKDEIRAAMKEGPGYRFSSEEAQAQQSRDDNEPRTSGEVARAAHRLALAARLRLRTEHLARAAHWLGNVFFQKGEVEEDEAAKEPIKKQEDEAYDLAENTRQELLRETREAVDRILSSSRKHQVQFNERKAKDDVTYFQSPGIKTQSVFGYITERIDLLNRNTTVIFAWRQRILDALRTPVNREVSADNADDDQYAEALDTQHNAEVLLQTYRPLLARRQAILNDQVAVGSTNVPAAMKDLEAAVNVARQARRRANILGADDVFDPSSDLSFEQQVLGEIDAGKLKHYSQLCKEMEAVSLDSLESEHKVKRLLAEQRSRLLKGSDKKEEEAVETLGPLTNMQYKLRKLIDDGLSDREEAIVLEGQSQLRAVVKHQNTVLEGLRRELEAFARIFNLRAEYFKQLQALSDALVDIDVAEGKKSTMLREMEMERDAALTTASKQESRLRYLEYLGKMEAEGLDEEARKCIICTDEISIGLLLASCGHIVCQKCFTSWYAQHRTCPICRAKIAGPKDYHRVVYSRPEEDDEDAGQNRGEASRDATANGARRPGKSKIVFNVAPLALRRAIEQINCKGRYGSKLEMLVRHLLFISDETPGEKTIVFSAFPRGLELVSDALRQNGVRYVHVSGSGGSAQTAASIQRFTQGEIDVLLLHSEATSAGLNLMATKNIIMLEPLVNSGAERQALGRVHRIGQVKETNVYVYYVRDSVEDRILRLAANRGQSLFLKEGLTQENGADEDSGQVIAGDIASTGKRERGDYVNSADDLLSCFFAEHLGDTGEAGGQAGGTSSGSSLPRQLTDAEHAREARLEAMRRRELAAQQRE